VCHPASRASLASVARPDLRPDADAVPDFDRTDLVSDASGRANYLMADN